MKPRSPFTQTFEELPGQLPLFPLENALLPGGELPLELSAPNDLALFLRALKTDQLIGMVQPDPGHPQRGVHEVGCAGRIRQYRERKDGKLNIMLTGLCRYRIIEQTANADGYLMARVDWADFAADYLVEEVELAIVQDFKQTLRGYFERHRMQVDWPTLDKLPIEQLVNNLVLVMNLDIDNKQRLLESATVSQRVMLFSGLLAQKARPIQASSVDSPRIN